MSDITAEHYVSSSLFRWFHHFNLQDTTTSFKDYCKKNVKCTWVHKELGQRLKNIVKEVVILRLALQNEIQEYYRADDPEYNTAYCKETCEGCKYLGTQCNELPELVYDIPTEMYKRYMKRFNAIIDKI